MTAASGYGLLTLHGDTVLDAWFPSPVLGATEGDPSEELAYLDGGEDDVRGVTRVVRLVEIADLDAAPSSTEDVWLRLHLLSHRLVKPHGVNLDGVFGLLANAGIGISLGDDCVVEAGCYVTAGTKVTVTDMDGKPAVVKAATLSGVDNILFRRNSVSGAIEAVPWKGDGIALNAALHAN